jgi:UDP-GlcNAc:undecaprenyl-phosphate/decaprenyl-phosphate GlcNAc-1-phosphate transferase
MTVLYFFLALAVSIAVGIVTNSLVINFAKTLGIRNKNDVTVRWSNESKPSLGGISMFFVFLVSGFVFSLLLAEELMLIQTEFIGLVIATSLGFAMGISDDAYDTRPFLKLSVQIGCGVIFAFTGNQVQLFDSEVVNVLITVLWVVTLMNSLNMLDNMDGITGTVTMFVLLSCLIIYWMSHGFFIDIWSMMMVACIGAMIAFLRFNINPSKMFMGDGGSQFVGVIVAFFTIKVLFSKELFVDDSALLGPILALIMLTPAAADTLTVVINRLKKGQSPMVGGKDHTTHHLVYSGKTDKQVWKVFLFLSILSALISIGAYDYAKENQYLSIILGCVYFILVFGFLYRNTIKFKQKAYFYF